MCGQLQTLTETELLTEVTERRQLAFDTRLRGSVLTERTEMAAGGLRRRCLVPLTLAALATTSAIARTRLGMVVSLPTSSELSASFGTSISEQGD